MTSLAGIARRHVIVVCHSLFVTSRNSDLNSGALETAEKKIITGAHKNKK
jgi:hypothetical protein